MLLNWSSAVTVTVTAVPAVTLLGAALTTKWVAAAALTATALLVPAIVRRGRVGGRHRLVAGRLERDAERARAAGQGRVGRQAGLAVGAGQVDRAGIGRCGVVELVLGRHRDGHGRTRRDAARGGADHEVGGGRGADRDGVAGAGDRRRGRVGGRHRLVARCLERDAERARTAGQGRVGRQAGLAVASWSSGPCRHRPSPCC